jgi:non-specific serine/threonine protein kinase
LIGRAQEVEAIERLLVVDGVRLLTLVGPAGVGKTRLALAAAGNDRVVERFSDGVTVVDLAPIRIPQDVLGAIARACGVTDTSPRPLGERLVASLQERVTLVVLDNFEQVLSAAASLAELLAACPSLALLVTSRAPLQIRWEQTLRVAPLPVPDLSMPLPPLAELMAIPSVMLFLQRARARRASFALTEKQAPLLGHLVAQLDGLPLALELAAARLDVLSLLSLTRRLADRMQLLAVEAPDLPERQQSLEAAVGWSYDLLSEGEQRLFRCLGVFVGRVSLDAVAAVDRIVGVGEDESGERKPGDRKETGRTLRQLLSLAEKSLLLPARPEELAGQQASATELEEFAESEDDEPTFGMLETVREYAWERLAAADELTVARRAHAYFYLALAEQADSHLRGPDQRIWWLRLEREQNNLRTALRWLLDQDDEAERAEGLRLAGALGWFWRMRGYNVEGRSWLEEALARAPQESEPGPRSRALAALGLILVIQGEVARARETLEQARTLAERRQDLVVMTLADTDLALCSVFAGDQVEGTLRLQEALRRWEALGHHQGMGIAFFYLGFAETAGNAVAALGHYTAALQWLAIAGDAQLAGYVHCYLGVTAWALGDVNRAVEQVREGVQTSVMLRDRYLLSLCAQVAVGLVGAHERRARLLGAADALSLATGAVSPGEPGGQEVVELRERLARGEGEGAVAYREGRTLSFSEIAALALRLLEDATQSRPSLKRPGPASQNPLTTREVEVLRLVAHGLSSKMIARQLSISPRTVNYHLDIIFNKLGVATRAQAAAVATQRELL